MVSSPFPDINTVFSFYITTTGCLVLLRITTLEVFVCENPRRSAGNEPGTKWTWKIALFKWQHPEFSAVWAVHSLEVPGLNSDLLSPSVIRSSLDRCSLTNEELRWMDEGPRLHCRFLLSHFASPLYYWLTSMKSFLFWPWQSQKRRKTKQNDNVECHHWKCENLVCEKLVS